MSKIDHALFRMALIVIVFLAHAGSHTYVFAQEMTVSGQITSSEDGSPLPGVNILVKGTVSGTVTDVEGSYRLDVPSDATTLVFSSIGYMTQEVDINGQSEINVTLAPDVQSLNEVVVVGYGEQSRETLTSAVSKVDEQVLENVPLTNAATALQGTVSGVRVQTVSGQPGASPRIILRGGTSINDPNGATPLYIVDGVIREDIDGINSADIESMQVLKDAAATSIYGARASNGVVIITTKKGKAGQTQINYKYTVGMSQLREKYDLLSAREYTYYGRLGVAATAALHPGRLSWLDASHGNGIGNDLTNETAFTPQILTPENEHKLNEGWQSMPDPLDSSRTIIFDETDWQNVLFRTGITNDHYLSFSGGSDKSTFSLGAGYTDVEGIAIHTNYKRFTANLNGRLQVRDNMYAFGGLNFSRSSDNEVYSDNHLFERAIALAPNAKYTYEDGTLAPGISRSLGNPAYHLSRYDNENKENIMTLMGGVNWEILPDLSFEPTASLLYKVGETNSFQKSYFNTPTQFIDSREASGSYSEWVQRQFDAILNYNKNFSNSHNFLATLGVSYFHRENRSLSAQGRGAATDLIPTLNASAEPVSVYSFASEQVILGYFGRITYDFERKYLFTLNARYDGASNLGADHKWGLFPGVSAGWNIHNENFWNNPAQISRLKLRASYGVNGNLGNLSDFQAQGQYSVGPRYQGEAAVEYRVPANQDLRWEQSKTLSFGLDAGFFEDRVNLLFDYYRRKTENLITSLAMPHESGFSSILTNLGSLENKGVEMELGANIINTNNFSWNVSFNASLNENKILKLPENENENNRIGGFYVYDPALGDYTWKGGLQEGGRMGDLYAYQHVSVYATDEEAAEGPYDEFRAGTPEKTNFGGDVKFLDIDENDTIDTRDRVYMGNIFPRWTGGLSSTATYKGISLYLRLDYTTGHTIFNYVRGSLNAQNQGDNNASTDILDSWLEQGDVTDVPRYYFSDLSAQNNRFRGISSLWGEGASSVLYESGDFLAVREITLSYNAPLTWTDNIGISNLRFYLTGNNLKYFTNYSGLAPEDGGTDRGRYPVPRVFMFGVNVSL